MTSGPNACLFGLLVAVEPGTKGGLSARSAEPGAGRFGSDDDQRAGPVLGAANRASGQGVAGGAFGVDHIGLRPVPPRRTHRAIELDDQLAPLVSRGLSGDDREEDLDQVQPGARGRGEVQGDPRIAGQPRAHGGVLVGDRCRPAAAPVGGPALRPSTGSRPRDVQLLALDLTAPG